MAQKQLKTGWRASCNATVCVYLLQSLSRKTIRILCSSQMSLGFMMSSGLLVQGLSQAGDPQGLTRDISLSSPQYFLYPFLKVPIGSPLFLLPFLFSIHPTSHPAFICPHLQLPPFPPLGSLSLGNIWLKCVVVAFEQLLADRPGSVTQIVWCLWLLLGQAPMSPP